MISRKVFTEQVSLIAEPVTTPLEAQRPSFGTEDIMIMKENYEKQGGKDTPWSIPPLK